MDSVLYVRLDGFYTSVVVRAEGAWVVHHKGRVLDGDATALARQVRPGTLLTEAKAVLQGLGRFVEYREEAFLEARNAWLDVCLEFSGAVEPGLAGEAWIDLRRVERVEGQRAG